MTSLNPPCAARLVSIAAALVIGGAAGSALAQGTAAQREACAPDAIRLCQDAIPDVAKTTACMKIHRAELSPSCRRMFVAATGEPRPGASSRRRTARVAPAAPVDDGLAAGEADLPSADAEDTPASRAADARNARRVVSRLCANNVLDANTCRLTQGAINLAQ